MISTAPSDARKVVSSSCRTACAVWALSEETTVSTLRFAVHIQETWTISAVASTAKSINAVSARPSLSRKRERSSVFAAGNEAGAALIGDIGPDPIEEDCEAVPEADQEPDMRKAP